ncbi:amidase domain-containing protein [Saccharothrix sp. ST-888]|uniref:amidase domain-containing protein n=1 Tax=Saccharothrix sp. ST-888 TaxID=1427391 RepID=UPI0018CE9516|nr:amidase domain-containing protein [Saccharothrix sp. ST-888]
MGAAVTAVLSAAALPSASAASATGPVDRTTVASFDRMAEAVLSQRTAALVDKAPAQHDALGADAHVGLAAGLARAEDTASSSLRTRKARLAVVGEAYSAGSTKVSVDKVRVSGGRADVEVTETTTLTYKKIRGDEPATTGFQAHHMVTFASTSHGHWELTGIKNVDSGVPAVNQPAPPVSKPADVDPPEATPAATSWPAASKPKAATGGGNNYAAMAAYAEKYWSKYNPAYPQFNGAGGDCTNFVSQALKAGGWKNVPGEDSDYHNWWSGSDSQSWSWVGADEWSWFALSSKRVSNLANVYQLGVGDILQADFDRDGSKNHSMIVTYLGLGGMPYVTYHSTNTYRRSVASLVMSNPNAAFYAYRT